MFLIRPARPADAAPVQALLQAAFPTAAEARLVKALDAAGQDTVSLVAADGDALTGHVLLSPVSLRGVCTADGGLGLAPLAVAPHRQGRGIGGWLVVAAVAAARRQGYRYVVVLGEPGYYSRFGFEPAARYGLDNEYGAGEEFRVLPLRAGALPPEGGLIRYAPAFEAVADTGSEA